MKSREAGNLPVLRLETTGHGATVCRNPSLSLPYTRLQRLEHSPWDRPRSCLIKRLPIEKPLSGGSPASGTSGTSMDAVPSEVFTAPFTPISSLTKQYPDRNPQIYQFRV